MLVIGCHDTILILEQVMMTVAKSTSSRGGRKATKKPPKPYPDYPLYAHASGRWAKKIRGKLHYFGRWDDPDRALSRYLDERDDLHAGRTPRIKRDGLTVRELCNRFLAAKETARDAGEIAAVTWSDYFQICKYLVEYFGPRRVVDDLRGDDFDKLRGAIAKTGNLVTQANKINRVRIVFRYAYEAELIEKPVRFGANFKRPSAKSLRKQPTKRMFEADEIRQMLDSARLPLKAMILLAVNAGFGNADIGRLPKSAIDWDNGWVQFPRPKTGSDRRCPLWPETIRSLKEAEDTRPQPASGEFADLVFLTKWGKPWHKEGSSYLSEQFRKFLRGDELYQRGVGFYTFRHVFETVGGECRDQPAVDSLMGHENGHMASVYRERVSDERLLAVTETVRTWLFGEPGGGETSQHKIEK